MKTIAIVLATLIISISCKKEINQVHQGEIDNATLSELIGGGVPPTDSVVFSPDPHPKLAFYDKTKDRFLIDSFYNTADMLIKRCSFSASHAGSTTTRVRMAIDEKMVDSLYKSTRYYFATDYFDFIRCIDTIKAGKHKIRFAGHTTPLVDTTNIFYSLYAGEFECYTLSGVKMGVYGLPITSVRWYIKGQTD